MVKNIRIFITLTLILVVLLSGCMKEITVGEWQEIADSVNSSHYLITNQEINRLCTEICGGEKYYYGFECPCNHCFCKCK